MQQHQQTPEEMVREHLENLYREYYPGNIFCKLAGIVPPTLSRYIRDGVAPKFVRIAGNGIRIKRSDAIDWIESGGARSRYIAKRAAAEAAKALRAEDADAKAAESTKKKQQQAPSSKKEGK